MELVGVKGSTFKYRDKQQWAMQHVADRECGKFSFVSPHKSAIMITVPNGSRKGIVILTVTTASGEAS